MSNGQNEDDVGRTFDTQSGRETGAVGSALHIHTPTFGRLTNLLDCLAELCLKISCRSGTALSVPLDRATYSALASAWNSTLGLAIQDRLRLLPNNIPGNSFCFSGPQLLAAAADLYLPGCFRLLVGDGIEAVD